MNDDECQYKTLGTPTEARIFSHAINSHLLSFLKEERPSGILKELVPNMEMNLVVVQLLSCV